MTRSANFGCQTQTLSLQWSSVWNGLSDRLCTTFHLTEILFVNVDQNRDPHLVEIVH